MHTTVYHHLKNKLRFFLGSFCICSLIGLSCAGQIQQNLSQFMYSATLVNPGATGIAEKPEIAVYYRKQWAAMSQSPSIQALSFQTPIKFGQMGIGAQMLNQTAFGERMTQFVLSYSYRIRIAKGLLSFGLQGGISQFQYNVSQFNQKDEEVLNSNQIQGFKPEMGAGIYYQSSRWFSGISVNNLVYSRRLSSPLFNQSPRILYLMLGYRLKLGSKLQIVSAIFLKTNIKQLTVAEPTISFKYQERLWLGCSWRMFQTLSFQGGLNVGKLMGGYNDIKLGYALDWTYAFIPSAYALSHELFLTLSFDWQKSPQQIRKSKTYYSPTFY